MALSITELMSELEEATQWQETPTPLFKEDYYKMVIRGIKKLFVDTNRPSAFDNSLIIEEETENESGEITKEIFYDMDLNIIEEAYILLVSKIEFFKRIQTDVNDKFGYTTDALTVTGADRPYANLKNSIEELEKERRIIYYKMIDYTLGYGG